MGWFRWKNGGSFGKERPVSKSALFVSSRLLLLNKLLEDGNTLFKKERLSEAAHRYQYALRRMPSDTSRNRSTFEQLSVHLLLNLSRCKRKAGHLTEAVEMANKVMGHPLEFGAKFCGEGTTVLTISSNLSKEKNDLFAEKK